MSNDTSLFNNNGWSDLRFTSADLTALTLLRNEITNGTNSGDVVCSETVAGVSANTDRKCALVELVGRRVTALKLSNDQRCLVVTHDQGESCYETSQECCEETWIADIIGVSCLLGHTVLNAENVEVPAVNDGRNSNRGPSDGRTEIDQFYGIKLITTGGYVDIVYRTTTDSSYGGNLERCSLGGEVCDLPMIAVTADYSA